jgi:hypothetical protein
MDVILNEIVQKIIQNIRDGKSAEDSYIMLLKIYNLEVIKAAMVLIKSRAR